MILFSHFYHSIYTIVRHRNNLLCANVSLRIYSLTHLLTYFTLTVRRTVSQCQRSVCYSCSTDYVELYSLTARRRSSDKPSTDLVGRLDNMEAVLLGRYCSEMLPGPHLSDERSSAMRVIFISNTVGINTGFRAKYEFIAKQPVSKRTLLSHVFVSRDIIVEFVGGDE